MSRIASIFMRPLLIASLLLSVVFLPETGRADDAAKIPPKHETTNVVLISLDILRPDHLGAYGYKRPTSPNIDLFAGQSVLFENSFAQSYLTPVAQMSVLTSQYPRVHGMVSFEVSKDNVTNRTLPEIMKMYGYETAAAISSPEFFMRFDTESGKLVSPKDVFSRSFDFYGRTFRSAGESLRVAPVEALEWLKKNKEKKFFLWVASGILHPPFSETVPAADRARFDKPGYVPFFERFPIRPDAKVKKDGVPPTEVQFHIFKGDYYLDFKPVYKLTEDDVAHIVGRYDAGLAYTDSFVGDLLKLLDSLNLSGKTLVVLHSIHGEGLGEHGYFFHYDAYDTEVKTALMMRFPDGEKAGARVSEVVQGVDILPTILDYLEIPPNPESQGGTLLPLIRGDKASRSGREYAFIDKMPWWESVLSGWHLDLQASHQAEYTDLEIEKMGDYRRLLAEKMGGPNDPPNCIAIRDERWKLIVRKQVDLLKSVSWWTFISGKPLPVEGVELYDVAADPYEQKNVARENPKVVDRLRAKLMEWDADNERRRSKVAPVRAPFVIPYP